MILVFFRSVFEFGGGGLEGVIILFGGKYKGLIKKKNNHSYVFMFFNCVCFMIA